MSSLQELQRDLSLLREYNTALEKENQTRNEERKVLQLEIDRLSKLERDGQLSIYPIIETQEYLELKGKYNSIEVRYSALEVRYNTLEVKYSTLEGKYNVLLVESEGLKGKLKDNTNSTGVVSYYEKQNIRLTEIIRSYEEKVVILQNKITTYEGKLLVCQSQINEFRRKQESTGSEQYQKSLRRIQELQGIVRGKNEEIVRVRIQGDEALRRKQEELLRRITDSDQSLRRREQQIKANKIQIEQNFRRQQEVNRLNRQLLSKDDQMNALKNQLGAYASRINSLSEELQRLERNHTGKGQEEVAHLRGQIEKFTSINGSLIIQINALKQENQQYSGRTNDLQRRILILEETNAALELQLRTVIENRKSSTPRLIEEGSLREALAELKAELIEVKQFNQAVRKENDELWLQLESGRHSVCHHPPRAHKSPLRDHRKRRTQGYYHSILPAEQDHQGYSHPVDSILSPSSQLVLSSQLTNLYPQESHLRHANQYNSLVYGTHHQGSKSPKGIVPASDRYKELQRKIQQLQSENQVLKKKLIYEV